MPYVAPYSEKPSGKWDNGVYANDYKMVESAFKKSILSVIIFSY